MSAEQCRVEARCLSALLDNLGPSVVADRLGADHAAAPVGTHTRTDLRASVTAAPSRPGADGSRAGWQSPGLRSNALVPGITEQRNDFTAKEQEKKNVLVLTQNTAIYSPGHNNMITVTFDMKGGTREEGLAPARPPKIMPYFKESRQEHRSVRHQRHHNRQAGSVASAHR